MFERKKLYKWFNGRNIPESVVFCPVHFDCLETVAVLDRDTNTTHFEYHCKKCNRDYHLVPTVKHNVVKNIIRKIVKATTKFISSDITREEREKIYDECAEQIKNPPIK